VIQKLEHEQVIAVMGSQWGDEGKGKLVDLLGANYDIIARCAGGSNAGVLKRKLLIHLCILTDNFNNRTHGCCGRQEVCISFDAFGYLE